MKYFIVAPRTSLSFDSNTFSIFATDHSVRDFLPSWIIITSPSFILHSCSFTLQFWFSLSSVKYSVRHLFLKCSKMLWRCWLFLFKSSLLTYDNVKSSFQSSSSVFTFTKLIFLPNSTWFGVSTLSVGSP